MTTAYPYDPTGLNPECLITTGEVYPIANFYNKWLCIIPIAAPFYRNDLIVRHKESGRELREGLDYHLGHRFAAATTTNKQMIYGSIFLEDKTLTGTVVFESYRTLGGVFTTSNKRRFEYLATDFVDPRNCDWDEVAKVIADVPPLHRPDDLEDAIATDLVTGAIYKLANTLTGTGSSTVTLFDTLITKLRTVDSQIKQWQILTHEHDMTNPHHVNCVQIDALQLTGSAADALKAFGLSLAELTKQINDIRLPRNMLSHYVLKAHPELSGLLKIEGDTAFVCSEQGQSSIDLDSGEINIISNGDVNFVADKSNKISADYVALSSGNNQLTIHSNSVEHQHAGLLYNGQILITKLNVGDYVPDIPADIFDVSHEDSATVTVRGKGSISAPLNATVLFVTASAGTAGTVSVTDSLFLSSTTVAASSKLTHALYAKLSTLASVDLKVNGITLDKNIVISKAELGLDKVENIGDSNMPLSNAFLNILKTKSPKVHTHNISDLKNVPLATNIITGVFYLTKKADYTVTDRAADGVMLKAIDDKHKEIKEVLKNTFPAGIFDVIRFGEFGFLPLPVVGIYPSPTASNTHAGGCLTVDDDRSVTALRNGSSLNGDGVYYIRAKLNDASEIIDLAPTPTAYHPAFLPAGKKITAILSRTDELIMAKDNVGQVWLIEAKESLNMNTHTKGYKITLPPIDKSYTHYSPMFHLFDGVVYLLITTPKIPNCGVYIYTVNYSSLSATTTSVFTAQTFETTDYWGGVHHNILHSVVPASKSSNVDGHTLFANLDPSYTAYDYGVVGYYTAREGNKCRVSTINRCWMNNGSKESQQFSDYSVTIDLVAKTVKPDGANHFPIVFKNGDWIANPRGRGTKNIGFGNLYGRYPFRRTNLYSGTNVQLVTNKNNGSMYEAIHSDGELAWGSDIVLNGTYPSVVEGNCVGTLFLPNRWMVTTNNVRNGTVLSQWTLDDSYGDHQSLGPTNERYMIDDPDFMVKASSFLTQALGGDVKHVGYNLRDGWLSTPSIWDPIKRTFKGPEVYIVKANHTAIKEDIKKALNLNNDTIQEDYLTLYLYNEDKMMSAAVYHWIIKGSTSGVVYAAIFKLTHNKAIGNVGKPVIGELVSTSKLNSSAQSIQYNNRYNCATVGSGFVEHEGKGYYLFNSSPFVYYVGWGGYWGFDAYTQTTGNSYTVKKTSLTFWHENSAQGRVCSPKFGATTTASLFGGSAIGGDYHGFVNSDIEQNRKLGTAILLAVDVSSNWVIYITQPQKFYISNTSHTLPKTYFDLRAMFPNAYTNSVFYVYATINIEGGAEYLVSKEFIADNYRSLLLGTFKTNATQVYDLELKAVTKLAISREMQEHFDDPNAHMKNSRLPRYLGLPDMVNHELSGAVRGKPVKGLLRYTESTDDVVLQKLYSVYASPELLKGGEFVMKRVHVPVADRIAVKIYADDNHKLFINGVFQKSMDRIVPPDNYIISTYVLKVTPNVPIQIGISCINTLGGPTGVKAAFIENGQMTLRSDESWLVWDFNKVPGADKFASVTSDLSTYGSSHLLKSVQNVLPKYKGPSILHGTATHGAEMPVPDGADKNKCRYLLSVKSCGSYTGSDTLDTALRNIDMYVKPDGVLYAKYSNSANGELKDITVAYICTVDE